MLDPFKNIQVNDRAFPPDQLEPMTAAASVAVGLALRKVGTNDQGKPASGGPKSSPSRRVPNINLEAFAASQNIVLIVILTMAFGFTGWRYYSLSATTKMMDQELEIAREQLEKVKKDREAIEVLKRRKTNSRSRSTSSRA